MPADTSVAPISKPRTSDFVQLIVLAAIWASAFQAIKIAVVDVGPLYVVFARVAIGALALLPWAIYRGFIWPIDKTQWIQVSALAGLSTIVPFFLISWAELTVSSAETALLMGSGPLTALVLSHVFTADDKLNSKKFIAVMLGFAGVVLIIGPNVLGEIGTELISQIAILIASFCYVSSGLLVRRISGMPPTRLSCLVLLISTVILAPITFAFAEFPHDVSSQALWALLYLGLFPTGLAYILRYRLVRQIGLSLFAHVGNLIPIFGIIFGAILLGEAITLEKLIALALILSGVAVARWGA